jgi:IclR family transcriptional regulator, KDG regulon repressor
VSSTYYLESVERVMRVLDAFAEEGEELRLTDLSERLGLSKPQVLRIVTTLEHGGYLIRDPETKRYRLGIRLLVLGMVVRQQMDLRRAAQPVLRQLWVDTQETVGLFIPDRLGPVCVDVIDSPHGLRVFAQQGRRMPWNAGSSAKAILAFMPEEEREAILRTTAFKQYTDQTITDPDSLRNLLDKVREAGYYSGSQDLDPGIGGIAAPIFDHECNLVGAMAVSAPISRLMESDLPRLISLVLDACRQTSEQLGHSSPELIDERPVAMHPLIS